MLLDPRDGDAEDDSSAPLARSMAMIAGGMLAEISPLKLAAASVVLVIFPALVLGLAPLIAGAWVASGAAMAAPEAATADTPSEGHRIWRIGHLSDVHVVGERYGFRIESGRLRVLPPETIRLPPLTAAGDGTA
jgi:hypothetical protein